MIERLRERLFLKKHLRMEFTSEPLRAYFRDKHRIDVGLYSYGCFDSARIAGGTRIGRYCSFAKTAHIFNGNHGLDFLSLHPYLYNVNLGYVEEETISRSQCVVSDDVWIGHNAIVLPSVRTIGRGAAIGAGAVVTKDVPPYAIVVGNPGRVIRFRFDEATQQEIELTRWWERSADDLRELICSHPNLVFRPASYFASRTQVVPPTLPIKAISSP